MRYHYKKPKLVYTKDVVHYCDHPVYDQCSLYSDEHKGLAVIQQRFNQEAKTTWWGKIDPWLYGDILQQPGFEDYFSKMARVGTYDGLYPTVTVRQIMWALRMKPLPKQPWETAFDHTPI